MIPVNPDQGEVAIPWSRQHDPRVASTHVVGVLGARAIRWVEEATGRGIDQIFVGFTRSMEAESFAGVSLREAAAIVWAAIEHHRRKRGAPGPEFTIDDADEICDEIGRQNFYAVAWHLMFWSVSSRQQRDRMEAEAREMGEADPLGELRAVAATGTGTPTSPQDSEQVSPTETSGS